MALLLLLLLSAQEPRWRCCYYADAAAMRRFMIRAIIDKRHTRSILLRHTLFRAMLRRYVWLRR